MCTTGPGPDLAGRGGRRTGARLNPGASFAIAVGVAFQFRNDGEEDLTALAITMPPWPGEAEAEFVPGPWEAILQA